MGTPGTPYGAAQGLVGWGDKLRQIPGKVLDWATLGPLTRAAQGMEPEGMKSDHQQMLDQMNQQANDQRVQAANQSFVDQAARDKASAAGGAQVADKKNGAADAFKESHKGRLHRALGVDPDKTIPEDKMRAALAGHHGRAVQQMAQAAHNINE